MSNVVWDGLTIIRWGPQPIMLVLPEACLSYHVSMVHSHADMVRLYLVCVSVCGLYRIVNDALLTLTVCGSPISPFLLSIVEYVGMYRYFQYLEFVYQHVCSNHILSTF